MATKNLSEQYASLDKIIGDSVGKAVEGAFTQSQMARDAKFMAKEVRRRTRLGRGVQRTGARSFKLAGLKESTIRSRRRTQNAGELSTDTSPTKSNLTETGQLLDAIDGRSSGPGNAEIFLKEDRTDGALNNDIASFQEDKKRSFMHLSDS